VVFEQFGLDLSGQSLVFAPRTVVASYVVGVLVTMVAAFFPARRTARIAPVQALSDDIALPETSIRRRLLVGFLLVATGLVALVFGLLLDVPQPLVFVGGGVLGVLLGVASASPVISRPFLAVAQRLYARGLGPVGNLAGQNALRNPRRTAATASALMIGLTLACTMAIVGDSAKSTVDKAVADAFVGDFVVSNVFSGEFNPGIADKMAGVDGVDSVVRERLQFLEVDGDEDFATAIDPEAVGPLELKLAQGSLALTDGSVLVQQQYADDHGLSVGDKVPVKPPKGAADWTVAGVIEDNPVIFTGLITTIATFEASGFEPSDNALIVFAADGVDPASLQEPLDDIVAKLPSVTVKNQDAFAKEQRAQIDNFVRIIYALLALALIIAVLGIVNTLALSIIERTREVGLLRAIGMSRRQLRRMIRLESIVIAMLGAVLGVVLGVFFGLVLMRSLRDEGLDVISVPVTQLAVFLVLALVIGVLAAVLPARRAARLDVLKAIATE
jgi:putative ABC transport system permease protein